MRKKLWMLVLFVALVMGSALPASATCKGDGFYHYEKANELPAMPLIEGYDYKLSTKEYKKEYKKYTLIVEKGIYVSKEFPATVTMLMDEIERVTGWSYYPQGNEPKVTVRVKKTEMTEYGMTIEYATEDGIVLMETDAADGELADEKSTILHELLHVIQLRNSGNASEILTEGFSESFEVSILESMGLDPTSHSRWNLDFGMRVYSWYYDKEDNSFITRENAEKYMFIEPAHSGHETSYLIVNYIREKYGDDFFFDLLGKVQKELEAPKYDSGRFSSYEDYTKTCNKACLEVIKKETKDSSFVENFYDWFTKYEYLQFEVPYKAKKGETLYPGFVLLRKENFTNPEDRWGVDLPYSIVIDDYVEIDYSGYIAYMQQVWNLDVVGFSINLADPLYVGIRNPEDYSDIYTIEYFDAKGNCLLKENDLQASGFFVQNAVKVRITNDGNTPLDLSLMGDCFYESEAEAIVTDHLCKKASFSWNEDSTECTVSFKCSVCDKKVKKAAKVTTATTAASLTTDGKVIRKATYGKFSTAKKETIKKVGSISLAKEKYTYTGKDITPEVVVKDSAGKLIPSEYYKVTYRNNVEVGKATVKVTFTGKYKGSKVLSCQIVPASVSVKSVKAGTNKLTVTLNKASKNDGFIVYVATDSKFKNVVKKKVVTSKTAKSAKITGLKSGTKCYIKVCSFETTRNGSKVLSEWKKYSKAVTVK